MQMDKGMDTGICCIKSPSRSPETTSAGLFESLAQLGGKMIVKYLKNQRHTP